MPNLLHYNMQIVTEESATIAMVKQIMSFSEPISFHVAAPRMSTIFQQQEVRTILHLYRLSS